MPIVNYVREHRRFIRYASDEKLTASEKLLWYVLMELFNQEAEGNVWPDDFIRISNNRVLSLLEPMGIDTMVRARNALKQHGRIDFRPGNKNKLNPAYRMIYFYPEGYTQNADNTGGNIQGNIPVNTGGNVPPNTGSIIINQNKGYTGTKMDFDEDDDDDGVCRAREDETDRIPDRRERESEIAAAFLRCFGRRAYPSEVNRLVWYGHTMRFQPGMVALAIEKAATEGAVKPVQYVLTILDDWHSEHVLQPHQVDGYQLLEDIRRGKAPVIAGTGDPYEDLKIRQDQRDARQRENADAGIEDDYPLAK